jgi:hypothetical protein
MKRFVLAITLTVGLATLTKADGPTALHPGVGQPHAAQGNQRAMWSEPPNLDGLFVSSEIIGSIGFESEIANDFVPTEPTITHVTWWGAFVDITEPCDPGIPTTGFNLRFFEDVNCAPGQVVADLSISNFSVEMVWCQQAFYPEYEYGADVNVAVVPGNRYWFCAQMQDHAYPPSWGRIEANGVTDCGGKFRSEYYGYPNWIGACDIIFQGCDFSQEFEGDHSEACCFPDAHCEYLLTSACTAAGGDPEGPGTSCDPNPCAPTPIQETHWGSVRSLFR